MVCLPVSKTGCPKGSGSIPTHTATEGEPLREWRRLLSVLPGESRVRFDYATLLQEPSSSSYSWKTCAAGAGYLRVALRKYTAEQLSQVAEMYANGATGREVRMCRAVVNHQETLNGS